MAEFAYRLLLGKFCFDSVRDWKFVEAGATFQAFVGLMIFVVDFIPTIDVEGSVFETGYFAPGSLVG